MSETTTAAALAHQQRLCKPPGSLGRLEQIAVWYAGARGRFPIAAPERSRLLVFAGDHGVVAEGVSPYSSSVTAAMVANFLSGGAAINSLAESCGVELTVVDVGVAGDLSLLSTLLREPRARFISAKVGSGTANLRREPAMGRSDAERALQTGSDLARSAVHEGVDLLLAGEMGIGNSTSAAALLAAFTGIDPELAVGRGTGLDDVGLAQKVSVVRDALALHRPNPNDPIGVLATLGGFEIAALTGLMLGGASVQIPIIVDGFISAAAALVAVRINPSVRDYLCLSHRSPEQGFAVLAQTLQLEPLFDLGMRLGEGTGAVIAAHLLRCAVRLQSQMATFSTAGISGRTAL